MTVETYKKIQIYSTQTYSTQSCTSTTQMQMNSVHQQHSPVTLKDKFESVCACSSRKPCLFCKWRRYYRGGMCSRCGLCVPVDGLVCVCLCVFMLLMCAVAEHRGVALLSVTPKSVREWPNAFLTWGKRRKKRQTDRLFYADTDFHIATTCVLKSVMACVCLLPPLCLFPHCWVCAASHNPLPARHANF